MSILVVGTVAFDSIQTPFGKAERCLGGSATYFSVAASFFTEVDLIAVIGEDFGDDDLAVCRGEYGYDLNVAQTRETQLNVFADFHPQLNEVQRRADVLFLANIHPELQ